MTTFAGFPTGKNPYVPIPEVFFTRVLPEIEDQSELKVTLHLFWLLAQKNGNPRCVSENELLGDALLQRSLKRRGDPRPVEERLRSGLEQAVARGTLLRVYLRVMQGIDNDVRVVGWYFFNTTRSRKIVAELEGGEMIPARMLNTQEEQYEQESEAPVSIRRFPSLRGLEPVEEESFSSVQVEVERPNIFVLYEQNIGLLSPMVAEKLKDAADQYPLEWIEAAFSEAVLHNKRRWAYIDAILRRWQTEGRQPWNA